MAKQSTRIVGPWADDESRDRRYFGAQPAVRARMRRFRFGGVYWIEIWPPGTVLGQADVRRAPRPAVGALPRLLWRESPNVSDRSTGISGIIIHETQGSYGGAVSWLCNPRSNVSAHIVVKEDGSEATQLVKWGDKAWHALQANNHTIGIEMAGFVHLANDKRQVLATARICAMLCKQFGVRTTVATDRGHGGITTHRALGNFGGGHHDPGGFDFAEFMAMVVSESKRPLPKSWGLS